MASANILSMAKPSPQENGKGFVEFSSTLRNTSANCLQFGRKNSDDSVSVVAFHSSPAQQMVSKAVASKRTIACSALQESSTSTVAAETKEVKAAPAKPKAPAKAPVKPLPQMMEEDIIPSLKAILETPQNQLSDIELFFEDNKLEGSFLKKGNSYSFWAFFPNGDLTGPKGFSLSSYGLGASTVEPFLVDEKKITARHIIFWVEKRLAAQGIIPVWKD
ncbi:PREDICTED: uncharacterized protein LOC101300149 isoform X1 [Fragaria vesca subsp. vesca]|uniref:uncharacterized protein LOC101300149 isoform X1 n=1 Tax=Fragaria vesca subsp. vesca TaxID=101020 RepID=UPI0002C329AB|nr:PREDICTED: uncharacterized protein LOC101300149 isoform X1 [Fragaria vesca subsp. vesca]